MSEIRCGACGTMTAVCDHVHADIEWFCARAEQAQADRTELLERALRAEAEVWRLRGIIAPFADAAERHGVRKVVDGDLWVSIGVASSAWLATTSDLPKGDK